MMLRTKSWWPCLAIVGVIALAACKDMLIQPAPRSSRVSLAVSYQVAPEYAKYVSSSGVAYDKADHVRVKVAHSGGVLLDTIVGFTPAPEVRLRLPLDIQDTIPQAQVLVEILKGRDPLFFGTEVVALIPGQTTTSAAAAVGLMPRPAAVRVPATARINAIGDTLTLKGAAVFATGDTVPDSPVTWSTVDPAVVTVSPSGQVISRANGTARVVATAAGRTDTTRVTVQQVLARVIVTPKGDSVAVGQTLRLTATAADSNNVSMPGTRFAWASSNTAIATVDSTGTVSGVATGTVDITASAGTLRDVAPVKVFAPAVGRYSVAELTASGMETMGYRMNENGEVAGFMSHPDSAGWHPMLWSNGKAIDLGSLGGEDGEAVDVNDLGQVVGISALPTHMEVVGTDTLWTSDDHAFIWENGVMTDLGTLVPGFQSWAYSINRAGDIVGSAEDSTGIERAVMWRNRQLIDLGFYGELFDISENGHMYGAQFTNVVNDSVNWGFDQHAIVRLNGVNTVQETPPGFMSLVIAGNDGGDAAGFYWLETDSNEELYPALWRGGRLVDISSGRTVQGQANDVNNSGQVVGIIAVPSVDQDLDYGFLWQNGARYDLNMLITDTAWRIFEAWSINDRGEILAAGCHTSGACNALILRPVATAAISGAAPRFTVTAEGAAAPRASVSRRDRIRRPWGNPPIGRTDPQRVRRER